MSPVVALIVKCDYQIDRQTPDKVIPISHAAKHRHLNMYKDVCMIQICFFLIVQKIKF